MKLCIGNLGKWNSVKWNETRRIGAILACFYVARVWQCQLGFLVNNNISVQYSIPAQYVLVVNCAVSSMTSRSLLTSYWIWSPGIWTSTVHGNYGSGSVNHYCLCVQHCLCGLHTHLDLETRGKSWITYWLTTDPSSDQSVYSNILQLMYAMSHFNFWLSLLISLSLSQSSV